MNEQVSAEAFFDSLSLAQKLDSYLDGFKREEIHLFSYFSALLYVYAGNSIGTWQHRYTVEEGYPFSDKIAAAIDRHYQNGLYDLKGDFFTITGRGVDEFNRFNDMLTFNEREKFLRAACATSFLLPYSQTLRALLNEPEIKKSVDIKNDSWLDVEGVYPKFKEISKAVGVQTEDLIIPAVTWINYLNAKDNS